MSDECGQKVLVWTLADLYTKLGYVLPMIDRDPIRAEQMIAELQVDLVKRMDNATPATCLRTLNARTNGGGDE